MKSKLAWMVVLVGFVGFLCAGVAGAGLILMGHGGWWGGVVQRVVSSSQNILDPDDGRLASARLSDPGWNPACEELGVIQIGDRGSPGSLKNFCLNGDGNILACFAPPSASEVGIRVYSPGGELLETWPLEVRPGAICTAQDGAIYVGGGGRLLKLDATGKVLASAASPVADVPVSMGKDMLELLDESIRSNPQELERMRLHLEQRRGEVTGLAVTDRDVFMAVPAPNDFTYQVYRYDRDLGEPKLVVEKLRGCCGQMDIQARDGNLWISHNARHRVESRDRDGHSLMTFGKAGKVRASDFGGCCEPKNIRVLANGEILAAESGPPTCIKRFSATGEFLGVVALLDQRSDCVRVTVEVNSDGSRYYLLDTQRDAIRIFGTKG